jgi:hemerythrin-like domain-containing protein
VVIAQAGEELRLLLERAVNGEVTPRSTIEVAAATYLVYYVNHIAAEEEDVLPLAAKELTSADWAAVRDAASERHKHKPPFGDAMEPRFHELRRRILAAGD